MEKNTMDLLLQRFLDGELSAEEYAKVELEIGRSADWKIRYDELRAVKIFLVRKAKLESPSKNFTQKVLAGLEAKQSTSFLSPKNGLLLLLGVMIASGFVIALISNGAFDQVSTSISLNTKGLKYELPSISIPFDLKRIIQGILLINTALAFVLLDRTILRPFFQRRSAGF